MQTALRTFSQSVERKFRPSSRAVHLHVAGLVICTVFLAWGGIEARSAEVWAILGFIAVSFWATIIPHFSHRWDILPVTRRMVHLLQEGCFIHIGHMHPSPNIIFTAMASHNEAVTHGFVGSLRPDDLARIAPELRQLESACPNQIFWVK